MTYWKLMGNSEVNSIEIYTSFSLSLLLSAPLFCLIRIKTVNVNNIWRICRKECLKTHFNSSKRNIIWLRWSRLEIVNSYHLICRLSRYVQLSHTFIQLSDLVLTLSDWFNGLFACFKNTFKIFHKKILWILNISNFL